MKTVKIDVHISDLLYQYDCVIVPDLGGFVGNYKSASINPIHHKFTPPSKQISFNKNLVINDGLLINHLSQRETITYQEATTLVQSFVNRSWDGLRKGDKVKIEKVGTLFLDADNNIQFLAEEGNDYLAESFGLNSFRALPIKQEKKTDKQIVKDLVEDTSESKIVPLRKPLYWNVAAVILILIISTFILKSDRINYQEIASYFPTNSVSEVEKYAPHSTEESAFESLSKSTEDDKFSTMENGRYVIGNKIETNLYSKEIVETINKKVDNTKVEVNKNGKQLRFHVMAGCFSNYRNAERLTKKLKKEGFQSSLLGEYKTLNAVSYQSFASREEALVLLEKVRNYHNSSAWLLEASF